MRALITKVVAGSMIAGAALIVSACNKPAETTVNDAMVTAESGTEMMANDAMMATDGAMNATGAMANDAMAAGGAMANDAMATANDAMATEKK